MNRLIIGVTASAISALLGSAGYLAAQTGYGVDWSRPTSAQQVQHIPTVSGGGVPVPTSGTITSGTSVQFVTLNATGQFVPVNGPPPPSLPQGSAYHQVVDIYYDGDGNKLDAKSHTHRIDYDCNRNLRRQDENLMVQDDGKGNVRFVQSRLPSEPLMGVKPVTPDGMVRAQLAMKRSPPIDIDAPAVVASTPQLASKE